ncbi:hypothetical protein M7I_0922 [Glarea lozoyensis 74030]|uniref:Uncharacterized protein n=1 Tax=Glarea lozoyensis (strain ATCC 74030 / MF5533) TaxID=1104152 RepID=H0EEP2_GLAL7|nr:hypothetical protein M7I_0922 [Glarea lozoyensis 74030]
MPALWAGGGREGGKGYLQQRPQLKIDLESCLARSALQ